MSIEEQIRKLRKQEKLLRKVKHRNPMEWKDQKKTTTDKSDITTGRDKSKDIGKRRETQKILGQDQAMQTKQDLPK